MSNFHIHRARIVKHTLLGAGRKSKQKTSKSHYMTRDEILRFFGFSGNAETSHAMERIASHFCLEPEGKPSEWKGFQFPPEKLEQILQNVFTQEFVPLSSLKKTNANLGNPDIFVSFMKLAKKRKLLDEILYVDLITGDKITKNKITKKHCIVSCISKSAFDNLVEFANKHYKN